METSMAFAIWAGFLSFFSPCCLPLYPSYLSYLSGISYNQTNEREAGKTIRVIAHAVCFMIGFSFLFYLLGLGTSFFSSLFVQYRELLRKTTAVLLVFMALFLFDLIRPTWLMKQYKVQWAGKRASFLGSVLVGVGYAAGWSPCMGPMLAALLAVTAAYPDNWFPLMTAYSIGFALPFIGLASFIGHIRWLNRYAGVMKRLSALLLLIVAWLLYTDQFAAIARLFM